MARYSLGAIATGAGTSTLPTMALAGVAGGGGTVREIGVSNTTNTACNIKLVRLSTAGTPGSAVTAPAAQLGQSVLAGAPRLILAQAYTSTGPTLTDLGYRFALGAAIGAGVIWTFGGDGLQILNATTSGIGVIGDAATPQILEIYFVWDE